MNRDEDAQVLREKLRNFAEAFEAADPERGIQSLARLYETALSLAAALATIDALEPSTPQPQYAVLDVERWDQELHRLLRLMHRAWESAPDDDLRVEQPAGTHQTSLDAAWVLTKVYGHVLAIQDSFERRTMEDGLWLGRFYYWVDWGSELLGTLAAIHGVVNMEDPRRAP